MQSAERSRLRAWLQLLRAPNLFTVPGDPLAGFLIAGGSFGGNLIVIWPMLGALACYCAGLASNDLFDLAEDRRERPDRPLASGAVSTNAAVLVAIVLALAGLGFSAMGGFRALLIGLLLLGAILAYNSGLKRVPFVGAVVMGACRGLSVLLGAAFVVDFIDQRQVWIVAGAVLLYIAAVTNLARHETSPGASRAAGWLPSMVPAFLCLGLSAGVPGQRDLSSIVAAGSMLFALFQTVGAGFRIARRSRPLPQEIGVLIRALLFMQAAFCASTGHFGLIAAAVLLALWPISRIVGRRFYAS